MRVLLSIALCLTWEATALAQQSRAEPKAATEGQNPSQALELQNGDAPTTTPLFSKPRLLVPIEMADTTTEPRPINFFPRTVFGPGTLRLGTGNRNERGPGVRFGDGTWKTHAAQVGGMIAGWAALAALCGGSRCMLPKGLTSWIPGTTTEGPPAPARVGPTLKGLPKLR